MKTTSVPEHEVERELLGLCSELGGIPEMASWASLELTKAIARSFPDREVSSLTLGEVVSLNQRLRERRIQESQP